MDAFTPEQKKAVAEVLDILTAAKLGVVLVVGTEVPGRQGGIFTNLTTDSAVDCLQEAASVAKNAEPIHPERMQ